MPLPLSYRFRYHLIYKKNIIREFLRSNDNGWAGPKTKHLMYFTFKKDLMPIELVWNDLKYYLCTEVQPQKMKELMKGVIDSWKNELDLPSRQNFI